MTSPKRYVLFLLWVALFFVFIWTRLSDAYSDRNFRPVLASDIGNIKPAGEVVAGFRMEQPINWKLLDKGILKQDASSAVCVSVLLANYSNRDNDGTFALSLRVDAVQHRVIVDAKTVLDNAYRRICFDDVAFGDISHKPTALIFEGIDSQPGRAITAWMVKDTVNGGAVLHDGTVSDRSLIFRIEVIRKSSEKLNHAIILTIICFLAGLLIILATFPRANSQSLGDSNTQRKK